MKIMQVLESYVSGRWTQGTGAAQTLLNPATEEPLATASSEGIDLAAALDHARNIGGPALRALSFSARGAILQGMADALQDARDELLGLGIANGGLVCALYSEDTAWLEQAVMGVAPWHGRIFLGHPKIELSPGPGTVLPQLVHGGPGRAGGGEELGGRRALSFYMQRVALEGSRPVIAALTKGSSAA